MIDDDTPPEPPEFPNRIRKARKAKRYSLEDLAARAGMSFQTLQRWEKKHPKLELKKVARLAEALEVTPEYLLPYVISLDADEKFIISRLRNASQQERRMIVKTVKSLTDRDEEPFETRKPRG